jgi:integrase
MIDVPPSASPHETGWRQFTAHARALGLEPLGAPALVATFLGALRDGGASAQTLSSRASAIRFFHRAAGLASPTDQRVVRDLLEGARRRRRPRSWPRHRYRQTLGRGPGAASAAGDPDRAVVLLTFASGRRRAEIAGVNVEDLDFSRSGFVILTHPHEQDRSGRRGPVRVDPADRQRTVRRGGARRVARYPGAEEGGRCSARFRRAGKCARCASMAASWPKS